MLPLTDASDPLARLSHAEKLRMGGEVLSSYVRVRRRLRRKDSLASLLADFEGRREDPPGELDTQVYWLARRLAHVVCRTLAALPADSRCLWQSLVVTEVLARRGIPSSLVIGVRSEPSFLAHSWVEHRGSPLLPVGEEDYRRLVEL
jgi:hypothetical protein